MLKLTNGNIPGFMFPVIRARLDFAMRIANALGVTVEDLFTIMEDPKGGTNG